MRVRLAWPLFVVLVLNVMVYMYGNSNKIGKITRTQDGMSPSLEDSKTGNRKYRSVKIPRSIENRHYGVETGEAWDEIKPRMTSDDYKGRNVTLPMNVLLIIADDLRPQFGWTRQAEPFREPRMFTPNIDRLFEESLVFSRAYTQYSLCGPSRTSLLTGRRPDVTKVHSNVEYWRDVGGNFSSMPQYFRERGYHTVGMGKIFHVGDLLQNQDDAFSWSEPFIHPRNYKKYPAHSHNWAKVPDNETLLDDVTAASAVERLQRFAHRDEESPPFFVAVGFHKPHIAHACPERYFVHYKLEHAQFLHNRSWQKPIYAPYTNMVPFLKGISNEELGHIPEMALKRLRRAYYACISYVDDLVGTLLKALEETNLDQSTIVVLLSDHGLHLGDNLHYGKYNNHEVATHVPLMIRIPGKTDHGIISNSLVELIDVFPTLVEASGITPLEHCPPNSGNITECTNGQSLVRFIHDAQASQKDAAFSQVNRGPIVREYAIRTDSYRYISLVKLNEGEKWCKNSTDWLSARDQLYNLAHDPAEAINIAHRIHHRGTVAELRIRLHNHVYSHNCL